MSEKKELFPVVTSKWNSNIEKNIKNIGESCKGYKWMHIRMARIASRRYNILMYLTIVTGPLGALFAAISASRDECHGDNTILQVLIIICASLSGFFGTVVKYSKYNQKSIDHKTSAAKYTSLEGNIRRQLSLYRDDRVNAGKYLQWVSVSFDDMFSGSPLISGDVYKDWVVFAKKNNLHVPKEYGIMVDINFKDPIKELANVGEIKVNNVQSSADLLENLREPRHRRANTLPDIKIDMKETEPKPVKTKSKRPERYTNYPDLNRFTDPRMEYELSRMFGMDD